MALVRLIDGRNVELSEKVGAELWQVLNGEVEGTEAQQNYAENVKKLYLNWRVAPDSYVRDRLWIIIPMATASWMVDRTGKPTRPEFSDVFGREFAKRWGLLEHGKPTSLVANPEMARSFQRELIDESRKDLA